jgi:hypothetical protein
MFEEKIAPRHGRSGARAAGTSTLTPRLPIQSLSSRPPPRAEECAALPISFLIGGYQN